MSSTRSGPPVNEFHEGVQDPASDRSHDDTLFFVCQYKKRENNLSRVARARAVRQMTSFGEVRFTYEQRSPLVASSSQTDEENLARKIRRSPGTNEDLNGWGPN